MKKMQKTKHSLFTLFTLIMTVSLIITMAPVTTATTGEYRSDLDVPQNVSAKATKKGTIVVKWGKVPGAKSYEVYRSTKENGKYKRVKKTKRAKFIDKKIHPKKKYYYKVAATMPANEMTVSSYHSETVSAKLKIAKSFKVKAYAYTGGGHTKTGQKCKEGRIAVDPNVIKLGTWLYVEGYGICQASDTGGNIKGKTIDVYKDKSSEVWKWGVKKPKVYILG